MTSERAGSGRRRPWWLISVTVAATVVMVILVVSILAWDGGDPPTSPADTSPVVAEDGDDWRWVSFRDLEVKAPAAWAFDYEAGRPDCIAKPQDPRDPWARDVPRAPYVMVGGGARAVPAIGCMRKANAGDPDPAFGALPFVLWQPYIKLDEARPDLGDPDREDGQWDHRGWRLTRTTIDEVQVTTLAAPDAPAIGDTVLASARHVQTTDLGCDSRSPVQGERNIEPTGPPIPATEDVGAVTICEYSRIPDRGGLDGSRRITGDRARTLVEAIHNAPTGGGPDRPETCVHDMYGERAIALRFFGAAGETKTPLAEAYVYYDWCFGNGIIDSKDRRQLTRANCGPLFAKPPIFYWGGSAPVASLCWRRGR